MEREEHGLRRKCEELRHALTTRTKELAQSQELYSKLKQRALLGQTPAVSPGVSRSRTPRHPAGLAVDAGHRQAQPQLPRPAIPVGGRAGASNYFPTSPKYSNAQTGSAALVEWNKPRFSQREFFPSSGSMQVADRQGQIYQPRRQATRQSGITGLPLSHRRPGWGLAQQHRY